MWLLTKLFIIYFKSIRVYSVRKAEINGVLINPLKAFRVVKTNQKALEIPGKINYINWLVTNA